MIFRVQFKDPDTLHDAILDAARKEVSQIVGIGKKEQAAIEEIRCQETGEKVAKWFRYGEYVLIELDTEKGTATVIEEK